MTRSTASRLADELVAIGLVRELDPVASSGPGRPAVPAAPGQGHLRGPRTGGQRLPAWPCAPSIWPARSWPSASSSTTSPPRRSGRPGRLADLLEPIAAIGAVGSARLVGAALALPGLVRDNTLLRAPNLGWSDIRPAEVLAPVLDRLGAGLVVENEATWPH